MRRILIATVLAFTLLSQVVNAQTPGSNNNWTGINTFTPPLAGANLSFQQADASSRVRTQQKRNTDWTSVLDFCNPANVGGSIDNTACVQAAITAVCNRTGGNHAGGTVYFPAGTYKVSSITMACPGIFLRGQGVADATTGGSGYVGALIVCTGSPCLYWTGGQTQNYANGGGITDINIDAHNGCPSACTVAITIEQNWMRTFEVRNVHVYEPTTFYYGLGGDAIEIKQVHVDGFQQLSGTVGLFDIESGTGGACNAQSCRNDATSLQDIDAEAGVTETGGACIRINDFSATTNLRNVRMINCYLGLQIACTNTANASSCPAFIEGHDLELDFCQNRCVQANDFFQMWCTQCYFHGSGRGDYVLAFECTNWCSGTNTTAGLLYLEDSQVDGAKDSCILLAVPQAIIRGNQIWNCNTNANSTGPKSQGIWATYENGTGSRNPLDRGSSTISDNIMCRAYGDTPTTMDGIGLAANVDYMHIHDNNVSSCHNAITNDSTAVHNQIHDN